MEANYERTAEINRLLESMGFRHALEGTKFLADAINILTDHPEMTTLDKLYQRMAEDKHKSKVTIAALIRYAIERSNTSMPHKELLFYCTCRIREKETALRAEHCL